MKLKVQKVNHYADILNPINSNEAGLDIVYPGHTIELMPGVVHSIPLGMIIQTENGYYASLESLNENQKNFPIVVTGKSIVNNSNDELVINVINIGKNVVRMGNGERICKIMFHKYEPASFEFVESFKEKTKETLK